MFRLAAPAACLLPGLSAGCRPAPEGPRPPRIPAERATLDAASVAPEPGIELRPPADRAGFDIAHYRLELDLSRPASGEFAAVATLRGDLAAGVEREIRLDKATARFERRPLGAAGGGADGRRASVRVDTREATLRIPGAAGAESVRFDPDVSVLATAELRRR